MAKSPIEEAKLAVCRSFNPEPCKNQTCSPCGVRAKAAVTAYLCTLHEQGPSDNVWDAGTECEHWTPRDIWDAMLAAHIKEVEGKI